MPRAKSKSVQIGVIAEIVFGSNLGIPDFRVYCFGCFSLVHKKANGRSTGGAQSSQVVREDQGDELIFSFRATSEPFGTFRITSWGPDGPYVCTV